MKASANIIAESSVRINPEFLNGLFFQENRKPLGRYMCFGAVHTVRLVETWPLTMHILTVMPTDKVRCTPLLCVQISGIESTALV
jgi:hypothetical protein